MSDLIGAAIGLSVLAALVWIAPGFIRRAERRRMEDEAREQAARRVVEGRKRMLDGRGADPDDRMRGNDARW